jgi:signal recognition particle subunit SRP54
VVDAMIGQDAVRTAKAFHERLAITGVVLTKLDGDARGGAALSVKEVTSAPVLFTGIGETLEKFEEFRADGMASRILGMGDVVSLMQDFEQVVDKKKAEEDAARMLQGEFTLDDFLEQVRMIQKMGSLRDLVDKIPMLSGQIPAGTNLDDRELVRIEAMIQSMTRQEKLDPYLLIREPGRVKRISKGSGQPEPGVSELVQKFLFMKQMIGNVGQNMGMLGKIPGMKQVNMARNMKKAMAGGMPMGMPGMGGMPGMPGMGFPGMGGMPGMGMGMPGFGMPATAGGGKDSLTAMKPLSKSEKNAKKAQRKREREARKKGRK